MFPCRGFFPRGPGVYIVGVAVSGEDWLPMIPGEAAMSLFFSRTPIALGECEEDAAPEGDPLQISPSQGLQTASRSRGSYCAFANTRDLLRAPQVA